MVLQDDSNVLQLPSVCIGYHPLQRHGATEYASGVRYQNEKHISKFPRVDEQVSLQPSLVWTQTQLPQH
jgi:hypothetical protein